MTCMCIVKMKILKTHLCKYKLYACEKECFIQDKCLSCLLKIDFKEKFIFREV